MIDAPRPTRIVVCPQEFKGSLDARAATEAIARAVRRAMPDAEVVEQPMADGGPGTAEIVGAANGGRLATARVTDAYGAPVDAEYYLYGEDLDGEGAPTAAIDSAAAVGLVATDPARRDPTRSTSRGVGELIRDAAARGARTVVLGVGGTASSDGGAGLARALGLRLLDANGEELPEGAIHLARLARIGGNLAAGLDGIEVRVAVDVQNRLTGAEGAVAVYGAQKGLAEWQAPALDAAIRRWAARAREDFGREVEDVRGAGAGGGIPAGVLAALPGARIESGAALVASAVGLDGLIVGADLVVTGEGSLDAQTAFGKAVAGVAAIAARQGVPCLAVAGVVGARPEGVADAEPLARSADETAAAMRDPERFVAAAVERLLERWRGRLRA